ncbi:6,7-dimethyl-8-ribityllumazine synthase [mine drainage metagenome]|uniref:6,7-dimethyl-8-ribityllumazine synthase n=1 Tax=mine drainage metagenome TaxID=410659 RepID=A0A1J5SAU1_9ZZZZ
MIAIIKAKFNSHITDLLEAGCTEYLKEQNRNYKVFECPGAIETVVYSKALIDTGRYKSIIVIGAIIKGDTDHYEYVCQYVTHGISMLSTQYTIPIIFGILTTQNEELAYKRAALDQMNKGKEFAETAIYMMDAFNMIPQPGLPK